MSIKYYKVLSVFNRALYSAVQNKYSIRYNIGKHTIPKIKNSKLFVFDSLEHAQNWNSDSEIIIAEVSIKNPSKPLTIVKVKSGYPEIQFEDYWNGKNLLHCDTMEAPKGTTLCDSLKLVKPVYVAKGLLIFPENLGTEILEFIKDLT